MQVGLIGTVAPGTQQAAFLIGRVGQQPVGLIRMGGNHHAVNRLCRAVSIFDGYATIAALDGYNIGSR